MFLFLRLNLIEIKRNMKYLKWWLQSYLVDIKVIKIGMRNDDGIVNKIIECTTRDIYFANNNRVKFLK